METVELPERAEVEFEPRPVVQPPEQADRLDALYAILGERYASGEHEVAARHNEHQPQSSQHRGGELPGRKTLMGPNLPGTNSEFFRLPIFGGGFISEP